MSDEAVEELTEERVESQEIEVLPEPPEDAHTDPPPQQPTVHVIVDRQDAGNVSVDVVATGDVRVTEIESLLRLAIKRWEAKIGIG